MAVVDNYLKQIAMEKRNIGEIIDDRSLNNIPLSEYTKQYQELEAIETMLTNYKCLKEVINKNNARFVIIK